MRRAVSPSGATNCSAAGTGTPPAAGRRKIPVSTTLAGSSGSLKRTITGALMSAVSVPLAGTVETTAGKSSSSTRSPVSKISPLAVSTPVNLASPLASTKTDSTVKLPTATGLKEKRPS